jgi:hypothetical protein
MFITCFDNKEHITNISNESIQTLSSIFNTSQLTATNITSTGALTAGDTTVNGSLIAKGNAQIGAPDKSVLLNNNLLFSNWWTNYPDDKTYGAEICNAAGGEKKLMIVGNKSDGSGVRKVGLWDDVTIGSNLRVGNSLEVVNALTVVNDLTVHNGNLVVDGRNILAELDTIKNSFIPWEQTLSVQPINDSSKCFDFGSHGRADCSNPWTNVVLTKR